MAGGAAPAALAEAPPQPAPLTPPPPPPPTREQVARPAAVDAAALSTDVSLAWLNVSLGLLGALAAGARHRPPPPPCAPPPPPPPPPPRARAHAGASGLAATLRLRDVRSSLTLRLGVRDGLWRLRPSQLAHMGCVLVPPPGRHGVLKRALLPTSGERPRAA